MPNKLKNYAGVIIMTLVLAAAVLTIIQLTKFLENPTGDAWDAICAIVTTILTGVGGLFLWMLNEEVRGKTAKDEKDQKEALAKLEASLADKIERAKSRRAILETKIRERLDFIRKFSEELDDCQAVFVPLAQREGEKPLPELLETLTQALERREALRRSAKKLMSARYVKDRHKQVYSEYDALLVEAILDVSRPGSSNTKDVEDVLAGRPEQLELHYRQLVEICSHFLEIDPDDDEGLRMDKLFFKSLDKEVAPAP